MSVSRPGDLWAVRVSSGRALLALSGAGHGHTCRTRRHRAGASFDQCAGARTSGERAISLSLAAPYSWMP